MSPPITTIATREITADSDRLRKKFHRLETAIFTSRIKVRSRAIVIEHRTLSVTHFEEF